MIYQYKGYIFSDLENVLTLVPKILKELQCIIANSDLIFDIRLILNELLINGCAHGNGYCSDKKVMIHVSVDQNYIIVDVCDEGEGIKHDPMDYDPCSMKGSGRGLRIVRKLSDDLIIRGNRVRAVIRNR